MSLRSTGLLKFNLNGQRLSVASKKSCLDALRRKWAFMLTSWLFDVHHRAAHVVSELNDGEKCIKCSSLRIALFISSDKARLKCAGDVNKYLSLVQYFSYYEQQRFRLIVSTADKWSTISTLLTSVRFTRFMFSFNISISQRPLSSVFLSLHFLL